jgi:hypothetical protein
LRTAFVLLAGFLPHAFSVRFGVDFRTAAFFGCPLVNPSVRTFVCTEARERFSLLAICDVVIDLYEPLRIETSDADQALTRRRSVDFFTILFMADLRDVALRIAHYSFSVHYGYPCRFIILNHTHAIVR